MEFDETKMKNKVREFKTHFVNRVGFSKYWPNFKNTDGIQTIFCPFSQKVSFTDQTFFYRPSCQHCMGCNNQHQRTKSRSFVHWDGNQAFPGISPDWLIIIVYNVFVTGGSILHQHISSNVSILTMVAEGGYDSSTSGLWAQVPGLLLKGMKTIFSKSFRTDNHIRFYLLVIIIGILRGCWDRRNATMICFMLLLKNKVMSK